MTGFSETFTRSHFIEVLEALHYDQTGLAQSLNELRDIACGWMWATESRGSYEWDDDRFFKEMHNCLEAIISKIDESLLKSSKAHQICCGKYRHINRSVKKASVQQEFDFGGRSHEDFVEDLIKMCVIEGAAYDK